MRSGPLWIATLSLSLGTHAIAAYALYLMTRPGDLPDQPMPGTELRMAAYEVPRSAARERATDADQVAARDASGTSLGQGAIATSRAVPLAPRAARQTDLEVTGNVVSNLDPGGIPSSPLDPSGGTAIAAAVPSPSTSVALSAPTAEISEGEIAASQLRASAITGQSQTAASPNAMETTAVVLANATAIPAAAQLPTTTVKKNEVEAPALSATEPTAAATPAASPVASQSLTSASLTATAIPSVARPASSDPPLTATEPAVLSVDEGQPEEATATPVAMRSEIAAGAPLEAAPARQTETTAESAESIAMEAERARARLAFQPNGDGPVDPVSLSAFQSFMEPGDLSGTAAEVRDGISGLLRAVPCSRLQVEFEPADNTLLVSGHVPEADLRATVQAALQSQMGANIAVRQDLLILPRPQCGALSGIANVGLPQSTDQITNPLLIGEGTHAREFRYTAGQPLVMTLQGADYDAFVYVDYFDADGNVLHLMPNEFTPLEETEAKSSLQIGAGAPLAPGEPGLYIEIGPPFGQEIAVAFAASEPLYEGVRPLVEPAAPYLDWLRERVAETRQRHEDFKGEWVYFFVSTAAE